MATKKCPKCGEENPAEAVMCWACYTPLAGGAAAAAGGGLVAPRGGAAAVSSSSTAVANEEKTKTDPKIFLVAGLLVGALLIGGFTTGVFGGGGDSSDSGGVTPLADPVGTGDVAPVDPPPNPPAPNINVNPNPPSSPPPTGQIAARWEVLVPPNPRYATGTVGIVALQPGISSAQAGELAKQARDSIAPNGRWTKMQVVVFNNRESARVFQKYQAKRQNTALSATQYRDMANSGVWTSVPAYLESEGNGAPRLFQPARNPNGWWSSAS